VRDERKPVAEEFQISEAPEELPGQIQAGPGVLLGVMQRTYQLKQHLMERSVTHEGDLRRQCDFLRKLLQVLRERCERLVQVERARQAEAESVPQEVKDEAAKWLRRVELIQSAIDRVLEGYGVTRYVPSGRASAERDEIRGARPCPGVEAGTIVEVPEPGHLWRGELLRPAQVIIAE
jgi:hypothetical protein